MKVSKIHHVAYRCRDARETVEWYGKYLDMDEVKWDMLNEWAEIRRAPRHARWMHDGLPGARAQAAV